MNWSCHTNWNTGRLLAMRQHLVPLVYHAVHIEVGFRAGRPSAASQQAFGLTDKLPSGPIKDGITRVANVLAEQSSLRLRGFA